ncbi:hypothetical protein FRX31_029911 [Thalictrum thalictroides]|uniref:RNase H type-1 domain-containing protein n=1 Tax=Thalictrum thalictroides TaxID=46969 RepID=A0A7J6V6G9_THATH|nr:hypothetical protein FRX31_029911 [Thalictrum thalictroides]
MAKALNLKFIEVELDSKCVHIFLMCKQHDVPIEVLPVIKDIRFLLSSFQKYKWRGMVLAGIYREGNGVANVLAKYASDLAGTLLWGQNNLYNQQRPESISNG